MISYIVLPRTDENIVLVKELIKEMKEQHQILHLRENIYLKIFIDRKEVILQKPDEIAVTILLRPDRSVDVYEKLIKPRIPEDHRAYEGYYDPLLDKLAEVHSKIGV